MMFNTVNGDGTSSYGVWINNVYLFLSSIIVLAYPVWLYFYLTKYYYYLQYKEFENKYGNAYDNIELYDNESAIWVPILYCLRRFAFAATCCFLHGYPIF